ncbi:hypothetical protein PLESTM_001656100 [Pleodorina starrii]|nr:hypothetical protein PLESTM_001656100 [Pleodorina starrii]
MPKQKDSGALEPQTSMRPSRLPPATLAPLPQRPTLEPVALPPAQSLSRPRLPLAIPGQDPQPLPADPSPLPAQPSLTTHSAADKKEAAAEPPPPPAPAASAAAASSPNDAREPASIAGLASPVAASAPADAAVPPEPAPQRSSRTALQPRKTPGQTNAQAAAVEPAEASAAARRPSQTNPPAAAAKAAGAAAAAAAPASQAAPATAAPPPLRDAPAPEPADPQSPTLPGAIPGTPTVEARVRFEAAVAAAPPAASRAGQREPPKEPPPPGAVDHVSLTTDGRTVEQYIPFGFVELRNKLLADFPHVFADPGVAKKFLELCKWISLRNSLRLELDYGDADEKYAPLDPDKDTLAFKAAAAAEGSPATGSGKVPAALEPVKSLLPKTDLKAMVADLYGELDRILDKAEFTELPPEDLEDAKKHKSLMGLEVTPAPEELLEYRLHYRGTRTKTIQFRRWWLFKRRIEMNVYERLAICFRLKKPVNEEDVPEEAFHGGSLGVDTRPWYRRLMCSRRPSVAPALLDLRDEFVYMKLFKDVLQSDVDMLLPGAVIKFTWLDYAMVWVPIVVGCGMAIWKAMNGTIDFTNLINAALSIVLIVMPITWGVRAYFAVKEQQRLHQAHLNAVYLTHNLNNNAGVISQLLGEAQEQEDNETMLAYFFLWLGEAAPRPLPKVELDRAVEAYLQRNLDELNVAVRMDYEVIDSITKLERLGLVHSTRGEDGVRRLQALPLDLALEKAHVRHFDESREVGQPEVHSAEAKRQGSIGLAWHECVDVFKPTGQKFRYFWNAHTGESQYHEPDEPYIKLGTAAALDLEDAYGVNMSDPKKQPTLQHAKTV